MDEAPEARASPAAGKVSLRLCSPLGLGGTGLGSAGTEPLAELVPSQL